MWVFSGFLDYGFINFFGVRLGLLRGELRWYLVVFFVFLGEGRDNYKFFGI